MTCRYQQSYAGHALAVYSLAWSAHLPRAFLSAGADWLVKLWDTDRPQVQCGSCVRFDSNAVIHLFSRVNAARCQATSSEPPAGYFAVTHGNTSMG